jgi:hypothetical protein
MPGPVAIACQTSSGVPGTSTSTCTDRRPDGSFFTLMLFPFLWETTTQRAQRHAGQCEIVDDAQVDGDNEKVLLTNFVVNDFLPEFRSI